MMFHISCLSLEVPEVISNQISEAEMAEASSTGNLTDDVIIIPDTPR